MSDWRKRLRGYFRDPVPDDAPAAEEHGRGEADEARDTLSGSGEEDAAALFVREVLRPAMNDLRREFRRYDREVLIEEAAASAAMTLMRDGAVECTYAIRVRPLKRMTFAFPGVDEDNPGEARPMAEVLVNDELQQRVPVDQLTVDGVIADFLDKYAKWSGW